jgi:DNA-binding SARP family transcriptional activator
MRFGVLGPLQVVAGDSGEPCVVTAARLRVLLAVLLWRANQPVPVGELAEMVWDGAPPAGAAEATRALVMRLRRRLGEHAAARIVTRAPGYVIEVCGGELDASRFEALTREAGTAVRAGRWADVATTSAEALGLWRGVPLADIPSQMLRDQWVPHLEQLRVQALEWRIDADLHGGRHEPVIPELRDLAALHPLRERFHAQLMLALVRSGRQAEALAAYQQVRRALADELGIDPGAELRQLHERVLAGDSSLTAPPAVPEAARTAAPQQLPAPVRHFTGREEELAVLSGLLGNGGGGPAALVISAIGGTAGVGKTALAVQWAHQVAGQFPDGQLYVNLRGYDADQPVLAVDALAGFLRAMGMAGQQIPADAGKRAAAYRSLLAGRRTLIVLDNAREVEQVRPLLPGDSTCVVVVTSRDTLAGLVARDGAARLDLDLLRPEEAISLLRHLIGDRADADPAATKALAEACCRLPLALRVAAEQAIARPGVPLAGLASELADQQRRLDLLDAGGDPRTAVRDVFSWSCDQLDAASARTFRLVSLHPGPDFDGYATAALTGSTIKQACQLLGRLARAHLIQPGAPGRYGMHDLLRGYARELASAGDGDDGERAVLTRLFDHYLHAAGTAMDALYPAECHWRPAVPPPTASAPPVNAAATARTWLSAELANLVAVTAHAARNGWPGHATRLSATVYRYLDIGGHATEAVAIHTWACRAARQTSDRNGEARALVSLGGVDRRQGRYQQAASNLKQALALYREIGDRAGEAEALNSLGEVMLATSLPADARTKHATALALASQTGDQYQQARAHHGLGHAHHDLGDLSQARRHWQQALTLHADLGAPQPGCCAKLAHSR